MQVDGKWWWFYGEEQFDADETRWLELADGVVTDQDGFAGSYIVDGLGLRISMPAGGGELVVRQAGPIIPSPIYMSGYFSDDDELVAFARDGEWASEMTAANRERAGRYTTIDVSMYPPATAAVRALGEATTLDQIEAALADLPKARFTHAA